MKADLIPYHICKAATDLFLEKGFEATSMDDIASAAGLSAAEVFTRFGNKEDIVLFLYKSINSDWQLYVNELSEKKLAVRFEKALLYKVELMAPYSEILATLISDLMRHSKIGITAPRTSHIRAMGLQTMQAIINGANDSERLKDKIAQLPSMLYLMHWAALFLQVQTGNRQKTVESVQLMCKMLMQANRLSFFLNLLPFIKDVSAWSETLINAEPLNHSTDRKILSALFNHRKTSSNDEECKGRSCEKCLAMHEVKINYFTSRNAPVHFILPAFPAKSPNNEKVLGKLPDLGEEIALKALEDLCEEIKSVYAPGAMVTICSDGRIFSDLVEVSDDDVTSYVEGIKEIINRLGLQKINVVNLEDLMEGASFGELRNKVMQHYAEPLEILNERLKNNREFKDLFNGIHRFISDDRKVLYRDKSNSSIKEESKPIALQVIQRSNAWTRFLAYIYPDAIRLSIHPYPAHSHKIGIALTKATDNWITPWHGVVVLQKDGYVLMKKKDAEALGATQVIKNNKLSHYTLIHS